MPVIGLKPGPQDPTYFGICLDNIVERLTPSNWSSKAIVRLGEAGPLYCWVCQGERGISGAPECRFFRVRVDGVEQPRKELERDFPELRDALVFANGEDAGELAQRTRPGRREDWPDQVAREQPWTVVFPSRMLRS